MKNVNKKAIDNLIKNFNRKLESYYTTFGVSSIEYQKLATAVHSYLKNNNILNIIKRQNGKIQIKRIKDSYNISTEIWHELTGIMSAFNMKEDKKRIMEQVRKSRKRRGMSFKEVRAKVTFKEIKEQAEINSQINIDVNEAMDFLYENDPNMEYPQTGEAYLIMSQSQKSYSDLMKVLSLANEVQQIIINTVGESNYHDKRLSYMQPNDLGIIRWDSYKERGMR